MVVREKAFTFIHVPDAFSDLQTQMTAKSLLFADFTEKSVERNKDKVQMWQ